MRAAASSIASGSPSSAAQIWLTAVRFSPTGENWAPAARARCRNSCTASLASGPSACSRPSGGTRSTASPYSRSGIRLVARIRVSGAAASSLVSIGVASSRCSRLSRTSSTGRSSKARMRASSAVPAEEGRRPSDRATAIASSPGSGTGARSANATPPGFASACSRAVCTASRVLPVPPAPVRVTSRETVKASWIACSSQVRPISGVVGTGGAAGSRCCSPSRGIVVGAEGEEGPEAGGAAVRCP